MSHPRQMMFQLFQSVLTPEDKILSPTKLVARVLKECAEKLQLSEYQAILQRYGLQMFARSFCQRYGPIPKDEKQDDEESLEQSEDNSEEQLELLLGPIDDNYLKQFPDLLVWEKKMAKKFGHRAAHLPSIEAHKEVCRMSPQERVEAGKAGIKAGQATVERFEILRDWGIRGGAQT